MNGKKISDFRTFHAMNQDAEDRLLKPNECRRKMNLRSGSVEGENAGICENIKGTTVETNPYYERGDVLIHSVENVASDSILFFVYNATASKNKIIEFSPYSERLPRIDLVLKHSLLNFKKNSRISANIIDGLLYWTDGYFSSYEENNFNPPRKINIAKAKAFTDKLQRSDLYWNYHRIESSTYHDETVVVYVGKTECPFPTGKYIVPFTQDGGVVGIRDKQSTGYCRLVGKSTVGGFYYVYTDRPFAGATKQTRAGHILAYESDMYFGVDFQVLDRVKYPPSESPSASYDNDTTQKVNKLRNNLFQFCYRWVYDDNEKSVFSPISEVPLPSTPELLNGAYDESAIRDNVINVWTNTGSMEVKSIELAVRNGNTGNWRLINRKYKYDQDGDCLLTSDIESLYQFYNNEVGEPLDQLEVARPFDYVPQISGSQELIEKNRLLDGNYVEGYDNLDIDVDLSVIPFSVSPGDIVGQFTGFDFIQEALVEYENGTTDFFSMGYLPFGPYQFFPGTSSNPVEFEEGYTYVVTIDAYPYKNYAGDTPGGIPVVPAPWANTYIRGTAVATAYNGMTLPEFKDIIIAQLRYVYFMQEYSVLALDPLSGGTYNLFPNSEIVSMNYAGGPGIGPSLHPYYVCAFLGKLTEYPDFRVSITKIRGLARYSHFKSGATHKLSLGYKDRAGRLNAVNSSAESSLTIPPPTRDDGAELKRNTIKWEINHTPPIWATEYSWFYAPKSSYEYYIQVPVADIGRKGLSDAIYIDVNSRIIDSIDRSKSLNMAPYEWQRGDRVRFLEKKTTSGDWELFDTIIDYEILGTFSPYDIEDIYLLDQKGDYILDQTGNKVVSKKYLHLMIQQFDYEGLGIEAGKCVVEIYRPQKTMNELIYYQIGGWYPVLKPHTEDRLHGGGYLGKPQTSVSPASGFLYNGDSYLTFRVLFDAFPCESMSYSDFYDSQDISIGRPNIESRDMRRKQFISNIRYSGLYIQNSLVNDLSRCSAGDFEYLAEKFEEINSIKELGYTLKILQKNKPTSIYVGKSGLKQADLGGSDVVTVTDSVLGSKAVWENGYGTVFPESVTVSNKYLYFYDIYNGAMLRWADNGIFPISDYGMKKYFRDKSRALLASGVDNIHVYTTFEREFDNLIVSFVDEADSSNNETLMFHEPTNAWTTFLDFTPECFGACGLKTVSGSGGQVYVHNTNENRNAFYERTAGPYSDVEFVSNAEPINVKVFNSLQVHSNKVWDAPDTGDVYVPTGGTAMQSRLKAARFVDREGIKTAAFARDMYTHGSEKVSDLINGRPLRGQSITIRLENTDQDEVKLLGCNVESTISE